MITDNQIASTLFTKPRLSRREARWVEILANFNITTLAWKVGRQNVLVDALSRIRIPNNVAELGNVSVIRVSDDDVLMEELKKYDDDQHFGRIYRSLNGCWPDCPKAKRRI